MHMHVTDKFGRDRDSGKGGFGGTGLQGGGEEGELGGTGIRGRGLHGKIWGLHYYLLPGMVVEGFGTGLLLCDPCLCLFFPLLLPTFSHHLVPELHIWIVCLGLGASSPAGKSLANLHSKSKSMLNCTPICDPMLHLRTPWLVLTFMTTILLSV